LERKVTLAVKIDDIWLKLNPTVELEPNLKIYRSHKSHYLTGLYLIIIFRAIAWET